MSSGSARTLAKSRWKKAGFIVKAANRFAKSRRSVVYASLAPGRSDSDDSDDEGDEEPTNISAAEKAARRAIEAQRRAKETDIAKEKCLAEYNESIEWTAKMGHGDKRRLSVLARAHEDSPEDEEHEKRGHGKCGRIDQAKSCSRVKDSVSTS